ncbi:MAG: primosomal protein N', partial [Clostridiales bacterium]|nr:primosomal protein N' [Clostridiales bacterium]
EFTIAKVAVEKTVYHFDKAFDYCVPETLLADAKPGCRVIVPFGGANSKRQGIILALTEQNDADCLKPILAVLDKAPLLSNEGLRLVSWMKEHYFCTLFDAVKLLLPAGMNLKIRTEYALAVNPDTLSMEDFSESEKQVIRYLAHAKTSVDRDKLLYAMGFSDDSVLQKLCSANVLVKSSGAVRRIGDAAQKMVRLTEISDLPKLTKKQKNVYDLLCEAGSASLKELCYFAGVTPAVVNTLASKGIVQYFEMEVYRNPYEHISGTGDAEDIVLSSEQQQAFENLYQQYRSGKGGVSLLYGVTGSGKTSVFMRLIDEVKGEGRGIIVMVPEISLTPQTVALFHKRYGRSVAVFHSGLSLGESLDEWKRVKNGEAQIAVGTRSAVFAPFQDLGIIIMDEEQEYTYKSESSPRYHAREVAKFRCAYHKALLVLSSATPSIESYYLAQNGRYSLNTLSTRFGCAELPEVTVVDMNRELENGNDTILSAELFSALNDNLKNGKQSILLLNRRGFHTFGSCKKCGQVVMCPHCSISLTYH